MSKAEPIPPTSSVIALRIPMIKKVSHEDANLKFLRSLPSVWHVVATMIRGQPGLDELEFDDLYNNLKVYEHELKGVSNSSSQNIAFLSTEIKGSTLKQSTADPENIPKGYTQAASSKVQTAPNCASHSDEIICSFFAQQASMPTTHDDEDLLQIDEDAMEEIDIRWQVAMITARIRKFMRKTGRPIDLKPKNGITFDKSKIECFNCQKLGHFARECRFAKYQENRANGRKEKKIVAIEDSNSKALVATDNNQEIDWTKEFDAEPVTFAMMALTELEEDDWSIENDAEPVHFGQDGLGDFDWSNKADDTPVSLALMATNSDVPYCSKCSESYKQLLQNYQTKKDNFQKARSEILGYQMSLESLEVIIKTHEKNEYAWGDKYEQMEYDLKLRDLKLEEKQKELDQVLKERDDFKAKGFHAVPPPTGTIIPPRANVSFTWIDELAIRNKVDSDDEETALNFSDIQKKTVLKSNNSETSFENSPDHLIKDCNLHERTFKQTQTHKPKGTQGSRDTRPVWNNINRVNHSNFSGNSRPRVPQAVLSQSTGRPYYPRMDNIRPRTSSFSTSTRSSTTRTSHRPQRPKKIMKSIWVKKESTVGSQAVLPQNVSVKGSAMINPTQTWRPKRDYLDSVNRDNGSYTLKQFEYGNPEEDLKDYAIIDSGCSGSMTGDKDKLSDFKEFKGGYVAFGNDPKGGRITGKGTIKTSCIDFEKVSYVEELKFNLLSVSQICDKKHNVLFTDKECLILSPKFKFVDEDLVILRAPRKNDVYSLDLKNIIPSGGVTCLVAKATKDEAVLWHRRLGHVNFKNINKLVKGNLVRGLPSKTFKLDHSCLACRKGKQHRASCKKIEERTVREPLELLHMDLFGPVSVESVNRKKYCLVVTDDCSKFSWVFFLAYKDETYDMLHDLIVGLENKLRHKVKTIRCDHGTEFKNHLMNEFCAKKGIKREYSIARTPQQNGVAERKNRTLIEAARTMLADSLLPIQFWAEAVNTACYVLNRVLVTKPQMKTPYEILMGRSPNISFMRPFGCPLTILNTLDQLGKFDGKSEEGYLLGYSTSSKGFRVYNRVTRKVQDCLHVDFLEDQENQKGKGPDWMFDLELLTPSMNYIPVRKENYADSGGKVSTYDDVEDLDDQQFIVHGPSINAAQNKHSEERTADKEVPLSSEEQALHDELVSLMHQESIAKVHNDAQRNAFEEEKRRIALEKGKESANSTLTLSTANTPSQSTGNTPTDSDDDVPKDGVFSTNSFDDENTDNEEDGAPDYNNMDHTIDVSSTPTLRIHKNHPQSQIIGKSTAGVLTRRKLKEKENPRKSSQALADESWVERARRKCIQFKTTRCHGYYGLTRWQRVIGNLIGFFETRGMIRGTIFKNKATTGLHKGTATSGSVDYDELDVKSAFLYGNIIEEVYVKQPPGFEDPAHPNKVYRVVKALYGLHQASKKENVYVDDIIFGYYQVFYGERSMIGCLMYLTASRPDIMFAVCLCARFQVTPKVSHMHAVKRIFRRMSIFGRRLVLGNARKQTIMAISSTEAEYVAAASCCAQVLWMQNQLLDYGFNFMNTEIHIDNESTICIVRNPVLHSKTMAYSVSASIYPSIVDERGEEVIKSWLRVVIDKFELESF
ncbi:putative ribonuclease H-like domain-containing protein [Tanacetum coccineum]